MSADVRGWLEANGLGELADLFDAHQIDRKALAVLTEQHLVELGVSLGVRVKLLAAIAQAADLVERPATVGGRRRLTAMFVDLVGFTELSGRLDPEDLGRVIKRYQHVVDLAAAHYGAYVGTYLGDGVPVYFGHPKAHEDDAERAVRAALEIRRDLANVRLPDGGELAARIGIATGLVVVGDLPGAGSARSNVVLGQTPALAARLQAAARPREILVSEPTRELIGSLFELRDLGKLTLKGIPAPAGAFSVLGESGIKSRFDARRASQLTAMVGRDQELEFLRDRWQQAKVGKGQIVLVVGEAGIGKSRVLRALRDSVAGDSAVTVPLQCSPYHSDSAMFPVIQQLTRAAKILPGDGAETRLDRLEVLLAELVNHEIALIAALLGLDATRRFGALDLSPQQQRLQTFDALLSQLARLTRRHPVLWVLEDAHWIDPTTLELIQRCIGQIGSLRLLAIVTARPDFKHEFGACSNLSRLQLGRLGPAEVATMVDGLTRGKSLPQPLMSEIVAKTDGIPLFVEEFTKSMLESGLVQETEDAFVIGTAPREIPVPASLHDSLMARLDRLEPFKEVAQTAACIGREFGVTLLRRVALMREPALQDALERLTEAELIYRRDGAQDPQYAFKHALVCDAAYESLLHSTREQIHARLVAALESVPETAPEIIAQHAARARLNAKAIEYWEKAASNAIARPAYREAVAHLKQAIRLVEEMGESREWQERRVRLWTLLGQASIPLYGYSHSETVSIFQHAHELANAIGGGPHRFSILYATWVAHYVRGEQDKALHVARSMMESAGDNEGHRLAAVRAFAISQMITGAPALASRTFEQALQLANTLRQRSRERRMAVADRFAADPEIATQFHVCLTLWSLGRIDEACALAVEAVAAARAMGHAHTMGHAVVHGAIFAVVCRDADLALTLSAESIEFARKHEMELWKGYGEILRAFALGLKGALPECVQFMQAGLVSMSRTQTGAMVPLHRAMHARALAALGLHQEAGRQAEAVREELRSGSERFFWPECQRLLGDYLLHTPGAQPGEIEAAYAGARTLAQQQSSPSWELYAATSLARFWADRGERGLAVDLLAPLCARFTQGLESPGYREATSVLRGLGN